MSRGEGILVAVTGRYHGLGNRMRVVLGAHVLAGLEGRSFAYVWPTGRGFGARLDELWAFDASRWPEALSRALAPAFPYRDASLEWIDETARRQRVWQIRTPHALALPDDAPSWHTELRALQPVERVRRRVLDLFGACANRPYLGVMIRSHPVAHDATLQASPVEWYLGRIEEIRSVRPDLGLYVAADTDAAFTRVARRFPDCFGQTDKGAYNSRRALQAAVADLYLLAASCHILGPHYSSFPELAQHLAGPAVALETSASAPWTRFEAQPELSVGTPLRPELRSPGRR
ncbi:hypothetical protein LQ757_01790 [Agromyces sp. SYSU K20354]|uniref:hypothetical protein n=1 Tax=Agromyces cavernae TaxID=2898659 RepID=UPI001E464303|nr:hypothetical protein [Agromyces cavernae]MCD2440997.1 hypothetical protein [Agromyces cavernae]